MNGNDLYTKLLLHCDGADSGVVFTDDSFAAPTHSVSVVAGAHTDTTVKKFGTASLQIPTSTGDYLSVSDHADWDFGDGDFTLDMWIRFDLVTTERWFIANYFSVSLKWAFGWRGAFSLIRMYMVNGGDSVALEGSWSPVADTWYHVAAIREGDTYRLTVDGVVKATVVSAGKTWPNVPAPLFVGYNDDGGFEFQGYIDEVRVSKGVARWTSFPFTPPSAPYTTVTPSDDIQTKVFSGRLHPPRRKTGLTGIEPLFVARVPTWADNDANVTASKLKVDSYNITWDAVRYTTYGGIEVEYEVSLNKDGAGYVMQAILPDSATDFDVCDLASGVYVARVRARYHKLTTIWYEAGYGSTDTFDLTSAFTWPATLPQTVSQPRYTEGMVSIVERSEMDSGPAKVRRRHTAGVERFSSTMQLTTAQVVTLEEFFEVSVQGGALEFAWTHPRTGVAVKIRFVNPPVITQLGPAHFDASLALEILP